MSKVNKYSKYPYDYEYYKIVNGKKYGPYTQIRYKHEWTLKDIERIAKHLNKKNGIGAADILIAVAFSVGLGFVFCKAAKAINSALSIMTFVEKISVVLGTSLLIQTVIQFLLQVKLVAPRWLSLLVALAIAALVFIERLLKAIDEFSENRDVILEGARAINTLCDKAKEYAGEIVSETCDATNAAACYWAEKKAHEVADLAKSDFDRAYHELIETTLWDRLVELIKDFYYSSFWNW